MRPLLILALCLSLPGCAIMKRTFSLSPPLNYDIQNVEHPKKGSVASIEQDYIDLTIAEIAIRGTINDKGEVIVAGDESPANIMIYVDTSITSSDNLCRFWFDAMISKKMKLASNQGLINIIGDGILSIGGLLGASTTGMGTFAMLLAGTNAGIENHQGFFNLNGTLPKVYKKLETARKEYKDRLLPAAESFTYKEAQREIRTYHDSCSRRSVENFIEASVDLATITVKSNKKVLDAINEGTVTASSMNLNDLLFGSKKRLSNERLFALYLIDNLEQDDPILADYLLKNSYNKLINNTWVTLEKGTTLAEKKKVTDIQLEINSIAETLDFEDIYLKVLAEGSKVSDSEQELGLARYTGMYKNAKKDANTMIVQDDDTSGSAVLSTEFSTLDSNNLAIKNLSDKKKKATEAIKIFEEWNKLKNGLIQAKARLKSLLKGKSKSKITGLKVVTQQ